MKASPQTRTASLIAALWQRNRPQVLERLAILEAAAVAAQAGTFSVEQKVEAEATAHKLAGSLGMYNFPLGTEAARSFELELNAPEPDPAKLMELAATLRAALFPDRETGPQ